MGISVMVLKLVGPDAPYEGSGGMSVAFKGARGDEDFQPAEVCQVLAKALRENSKAFDLFDPFQELSDLGELVDQLVADLKGPAEEVSQREGSLFGWVRNRWPSRRREARLLLAINKFMRGVTELESQTMARANQGEEPDPQEGPISGLTREDFGDRE